MRYLTEISTIDFSRNEPDVKEIDHMLRKHGMFFVEGFSHKYGFDVKGLFKEAEQFFSLSQEKKEIFNASHANEYLGYRGIGTEGDLITDYGEQCEQYKFGYGRNLTGSSSSILLDCFDAHKLIFHHHAKVAFKALESLGDMILSIIGANLNLGADYFSRFCSNPTHNLGLNSYPSTPLDHQNNDDKGYAMSPHKDLTMFTIIIQDSPGLAVQDKKADEWQLIPYRENTLIVIMGEYLEQWTNSYYPAVMHKVVRPKERKRLSILFKYRLGFDAVIPVIPHINPEKPDNNRQEIHTGETYAKYINKLMNHRSKLT